MVERVSGSAEEGKKRGVMVMADDNNMSHPQFRLLLILPPHLTWFWMQTGPDKSVFPPLLHKEKKRYNQQQASKAVNTNNGESKWFLWLWCSFPLLLIISSEPFAHHFCLLLLLLPHWMGEYLEGPFSLSWSSSPISMQPPPNRKDAKK